MSFMTSNYIIKLRAFTRKIGINKYITMAVSPSRYESYFWDDFNSYIKNNDIIWDVGANVGVYTSNFLDLVGSGGMVVAFEPIPECCSILTKKFHADPNVLIKNIALGDTNGTIDMEVGLDPLSVTNHCVSESLKNSEIDTVSVEIKTAFTVIKKNPDIFPNIIKIDVEGHEGAVFDGLKDVLFDRRIRMVGVEVHFGILEERGESQAPAKIQKILQSNGFSIKWTDASHFIANR